MPETKETKEAKPDLQSTACKVVESSHVDCVIKPNQVAKSQRWTQSISNRTPVYIKRLAPRLRKLLVLAVLMFQATTVVRTSLWFRDGTWKPHETTSALQAVCFNRTCTTQPLGLNAGVARMHVNGAFSTRSVTRASVFQNVIADGMDLGKDLMTDMWIWFLRQQTDLNSGRFVASNLVNAGFILCLTKACTNTVRYNIAGVLYTVQESSSNASASLKAMNLHDRICYRAYHVDPSLSTRPSAEVAAVAGGIAGAEVLYPSLMAEIGGIVDDKPMTYLDLRAHFLCSDPVESGGQLIYHGLDAGHVLLPQKYKPWKRALLDTTYAIGSCHSLDADNQYRLGIVPSSYQKYNGLYGYEATQMSYGGVSSNWQNGSLLPGFESILDAKKLVDYIAACDSLKEFFLSRDLSVNKTDVRTSAPYVVSASRSLPYAFKAVIMGKVLPATYKVAFPGGLEISLEDPTASETRFDYKKQSSILTITTRNSRVGFLTSSLIVQEATASSLSYLEHDILTGIYAFPGLETLTTKLLNVTFASMENDFCNYYGSTTHDRRTEANKTATYKALCHNLFAAYNDWK